MTTLPNLSQELNSILDISEMPKDVNVAPSWTAYFLLSPYDAATVGQVLPEPLESLLERRYHSSPILISSASTDSFEGALRYSSGPAKRSTYQNDLIENHIRSENLWDSFILKIETDNVYLVRDPEDFLVLVVPMGCSLIEELGGVSLILEINELIFESGLTGFSRDELDRFNRIFNRL